MVDQARADLNDVFHALSDPTRRTILGMLKRRPHYIGELVAPFDISFNAVSKHVKTLERAGLVEREPVGTFCRLHLRTEALNDAYRWLGAYEQFWNERLDKLEAVLASRKTKRARR
jgi:DNA-binding transcriptional ArsR family regulator